MIMKKTAGLFLLLPALCLFCLRTVAADIAAGSRAPEQPRAAVDLPDDRQPRRTIRVGTGGNLKAALNEAQPGDVIELAAGAFFEGPVSLPKKAGPGWIVIRTSTPDSLLPPGTRIDPASAGLLSGLEGARDGVVTALDGAHHYAFVGIEIRPRRGVFLYNLVNLGGPAGSSGELPHHIVFSRCFIHGDPLVGTRRGIAMNSGAAAVIDSYLSDFKEVGADSQAIAGWAGPGPYKVINNYLEGAGENIMFGGADPAIHGLVPSDIEIRRNWFAKPLSWRSGDTAFEGTAWSIKNLFELKNARRVLVDGNVFENSWGQSQDGFAILFTVRNQEGTAPWSQVSDVTFTNNIVRHAASGIYLLGRDNAGGPSERTSRILIGNNLFLDIDGGKWSGKGTLFQLINGTTDVDINHNTAFQSGNILTAEGPPHERFTFRSNVAPHNDYGMTGTGTGVGLATLRAFFPASDVSGNLIVGGPASLYPPSNFFPPSLKAAGLTGTVDDLKRLTQQPRLAGTGAGGKRIGVDLDALLSALGWRSTDSPFGKGAGGYRSEDRRVP